MAPPASKARLDEIEDELKDVEHQLKELGLRKESLIQERQELQLKEWELESSKLDWETKSFEWSSRMDEVLETVFKIRAGGYRSLQLSAMNAFTAGNDVILIMPTGGGKSLCYQLTALARAGSHQQQQLKGGFTLVVSPLVSLMEDQIMGLRRLGVPSSTAALLSAASGKDEVNSVQEAMVRQASELRLLYVTPEKLAKSKRFMAKLQKAYSIGNFVQVAIDEVHCCSQWGHDFRPDYKFLGVLRSLFPKVPMMGLTATITSQVMQDVKGILNISRCLLFKSSFNRPNLFYEVRRKPDSHEEVVTDLYDLVSKEFRGQTGIIYTITVKDADALSSDLRARGIKCGPYHASLEPETRSKVHRKWSEGEYQVVVATIAFGMGIDKSDVRFVIHHSLSKSMENYYQESGRAGRDDKAARCILFYKFSDVFRLSTMVFTEQTGLAKLYEMVGYSIDANRCRRTIISQHFDEAWETTKCNGMCDHCSAPSSNCDENFDATDYVEAILQTLEQAADADLKVTVIKVLDALQGKGPANLRPKGAAKVGEFGRQTAEVVLANMILNGILKEDFHFTPYSTISYITQGLSKPRYPFKISLRNDDGPSRAKRPKLGLKD